MPKINNSEVIQKMMDELRLYPGTDIIPTELADKILPVYNINSETVATVSAASSNVVESGAVTNTQNITMYTVPSTGKFFLTNVSLSTCLDGDAAPSAGTISSWVGVTPKGGSAKNILYHAIFDTLASVTNNCCNDFNLQNPLELEPGSLITLDSLGSDSIKATSTIVGYTSA